MKIKRKERAEGKSWEESGKQGLVLFGFEWRGKICLFEVVEGIRGTLVLLVLMVELAVVHHPGKIRHTGIQDRDICIRSSRLTASGLKNGPLDGNI